MLEPGQSLVRWFSRVWCEHTEDSTLASQIESDTQAMREVVRIQEENDFLTKLAGAWSTMPAWPETQTFLPGKG